MNDRTLVIGIDYGTDSVRALLVDAITGERRGTSVAYYRRWAEGLYCDPRRDQYRQHPQDYVESLEEALGALFEQAGPDAASRVAGISFDTTGSTPCLVGPDGVPLSLTEEFAGDPDAMFVLWKDHTAIAEAAKINRIAKLRNTDYLKYVGGVYSSEWSWAKVAHILKNNDKVASAARSFVEHCDWMPALLAGRQGLAGMPRGRCAAGHKTLWADEWDGLPDEDFLCDIEPRLKGFRSAFARETLTSDRAVGALTAEWSQRLGLPEGVVIGAGAFDCHMGAVGGGVRPGALTRVIGTSTCDIMIAAPGELEGRTVSGICGQVDGSVVPGMVGLEAGQSAFGDLFAWFAGLLAWPMSMAGSGSDDAAASRARIIDALSAAAEKIDPATSSVYAVDWINGRRTPDANQAVKGAIAGLSLGADAPEIFRALVEASCFGSRAIVDRLRAEGVAINEVIALGGVAQKSPFVMQVMADVLDMPIRVAREEQTCALGAAMFASVAAGLHDEIGAAQSAMGDGLSQEYKPDGGRAALYEELFKTRYQTLGAFAESASDAAAARA